MEVFQGCLVVVSHDNFFVNRVAEHLFVFQGDGVVRDFQGSYTDFLEDRRDALGRNCLFKDEEEEEDWGSGADAGVVDGVSSGADVVGDTKSVGSSGDSTGSINVKANNVHPAPSAITESEALPTTPKLSYEERKELNKVERELSKINVQISALNERIAAGYADSQQDRATCDALSAELKALMKTHTEKEQRWRQLNARMNK